MLINTNTNQGIAIVMPDTSPRHSESVPDVDSYDLGIGAGFYLNATSEPYSKHYRMYDYITKELSQILDVELNIGKNGLKSIMGHSMGGHGALCVREFYYSFVNSFHTLLFLFLTHFVVHMYVDCFERCCCMA